MSFSEKDLEEEQFCRICGYNFGGPVWHPIEGPSYDICPCCLGETGVDDFNIEHVHAYRQKWLEKGGIWRTQPWQQPKEDREPPSWNREEQMKNIPPEWL